MATIPMIGDVTVGGAKKNVAIEYININGVWKAFAKTYININGVWKNAWKELYTWKKYTVKSTTMYTENDTGETTVKVGTTVAYYGSTYTFDSSTGEYTIKSPTKGTYGNLNSTKKYCVTASSGTGSIMHRYISRAGASANAYVTVGIHSATSKTTETQGTYISDVTSENSSAYPTNGKHTDGYWYVKQ